MATFIWPPEVQWPPPAHILLNYDVVAPGGVLLSSRRDRRGEMEEEAMTRVVIVGELYNADLGVGGGPVYPPPQRPVDPGWGVTPPTDPGWGVGWQPGGGWATNPIYRPDKPTPPGVPQGGTEVPPDVMPPPPVPEEIASQYIVSVYNPKTMTWTTKSYPPPAA